MDTAGSERIATALGSQAVRLSMKEEQLSSLSRGVQSLALHQDESRNRFSSLSEPPKQRGLNLPHQSLLPSPLSPTPDQDFTYPPGRCKLFLIECDMQFKLSPQQFHADRAKVAYIISNLGGRARAWATAEWGQCLQHSPGLPGRPPQDLRPSGCRPRKGKAIVN